jgi:hypothetical protein
VSVRRLFITAGRWLERTMVDVAFEPHGLLLWARIERELRGYFSGLYRQGALRASEETRSREMRRETNPQDVQARARWYRGRLAPTGTNSWRCGSSTGRAA